VLIAYFYQLPPTFDEKMTKNALSILRWASLFYMFFGYWQLSNLSIFHNYWTYIKDSASKRISGHLISEIHVDHASPLLLMGTAIFAIIFLQTFFNKYLKRWGFSFGTASLNVDENLPFFFTGLKLKDADWLLQEYTNLYENYGFSILGKKVARILDTVGTPKKSITGVPFYFVLANPHYSRDFQYISCDTPDRDKLIKDDDDDDENDCEQSDLVAILLNMAYIPEEIMEQFKFENGFNKTFKPLMDAYHERKGTSSSGKTSSPLEKSSSSEKDGKREDGIIVEEEDENEDENSKLLKKD
jgi:hypothetical protein